MPPWKVDPAGHKFIGLDPLDRLVRSKSFNGGSQTVRAKGNPRDLPRHRRHRATAGSSARPISWSRCRHRSCLPADGPDVSRVFVLPLPVDRLRYVRGIEFRANNPRIHHANIRVDATPASRELDEQRCRARLRRHHSCDPRSIPTDISSDGRQARPLRFCLQGLAWTLDAERATSSSSCTLCLAESPNRSSRQSASTSQTIRLTQTPVMMRLSNQRIDIPARRRELHRRATRSCCRSTSRCSPLQPHAHYLARDVYRHRRRCRTEAAESLISISDWDLRWQHVYRYQDSRAAAERHDRDACGIGTTTPPRNPRNPAAPPVRVPWGQQSREEMGDFWLQVDAEERRPSAQLLDQTFRAKWMATDVVGLESLIQREPDRAALRDDIAVLYMELNRPAEAVPHFEAALRLKPGLGVRPLQLRHRARRPPAATRTRSPSISARSRCGPTTPSPTTTWERRCFSLGRASTRTRSRSGKPHASILSLGEAHLNVGLVSRALGDCS